MSYGVGCRRSSDLALLWLWCRPVATTPIRPLAWESPYATGAALKKGKKKKEFYIVVVLNFRSLIHFEFIYLVSIQLPSYAYGYSLLASFVENSVIPCGIISALLKII